MTNELLADTPGAAAQMGPESWMVMTRNASCERDAEFGVQRHKGSARSDRLRSGDCMVWVRESDLARHVASAGACPVVAGEEHGLDGSEDTSAPAEAGISSPAGPGDGSDMVDPTDGEDRQRKIGSEDPTIHESAGSEGETLGPESTMGAIRARQGDDVDPSVELDEPSTVVSKTQLGPPAPPTGGQRRYTVRGEIARGGMGAIFKVRDEDLRRSLAMKVMLGKVTRAPKDREPFEPDQLARFLEEAQVTAQLAHPGVVPVHDLGVDDTGRVFFTMSLVRGKTLSEIIKLARDGREGWDRARALQTILRVCETVAFAHDKGVIHRDLKPANIMVGKFGEVYVMDWGLAKVRGQGDRHDIRLRPPDVPRSTRIQTDRTETPTHHESPIMTMDGSVVGTPCYMPPEQAKGQIEQVDERSDVYAIGAMLYQLLTGRPPYLDSGARMSPRTLLASVVMGPPRPIHEMASDAPPELQAIAEKAMDRDRTRRYERAKSLADDLQRFLSGHVVLAHKTGALIELRKWVARNRGVAATAAAALIVVAGVTGFFLDSLTDERNRAMRAEREATDRASEASDERERADRRAAEAERERERAEQLASFMLNDLRDGLKPIGRLDLLGDVARESLKYYQSLPTEGLGDEQWRGRGVALEHVGDVLLAQGILPAAFTSYRASLEIRERLAERDPTNTTWQRHLAVSHNKVGDVLLEQADLAEALASYKRSLATFERLAEQEPSNAASRTDVAAGHVSVGTVLRAQGDLPGALTHYRASLAIRERLTEQDPTNASWRRAVSHGHIAVGDAQRYQGDLGGALASFRASLAILGHTETGTQTTPT